MYRPTAAPPDLDRLPRFTFAGRGCRDARRERRRPAALSRPAAPAPGAPGPSTLAASGGQRCGATTSGTARCGATTSGTAGSGGTPPASPASGAALPPSGRTAGESAARAGDRPPPSAEALGYGPGP